MNDNAIKSQSDVCIECTTDSQKKEEVQVSKTKKIVSMIFFGVSGLILILTNKALFTIYSFPSFLFLALLQCSVTIIISMVAAVSNVIELPKVSINVAIEVVPITICYLGNLIFGLMATKNLTLPMFTTLRRCALPVTMVLQFYVLKIKPSNWSYLTVSIILTGTVIAAIRDFSVNLIGYCSIISYNICTALESVLLKKSLNKYKKYTRVQLVFLCSLCSLLPLTALNLYQDEFYEYFSNFGYWVEIPFLVVFSLSLVFGFVFNYSTVLCNDYTNPLTLQIIGQLRSIIVIFVGFIFEGDYKFDVINVIGINLCLIGSLVHTYFAVKSKSLSKNSRNNRLDK